MKKKYIFILTFCLIAVSFLLFFLINKKSKTSSEVFWPVTLPSAVTKAIAASALDDIYQDYKPSGGSVVLVTDKSNVDDNGYNQAAFEGAMTYAQAAGISYSSYSAAEDTQEEYLRVLESAIANDAELIICAGSHYAQAVGRLQKTCPDVDFLLIDAVPLNENDKPIPALENTYCLTFREEEAGYLAGYMAVLDGYTSLGFIGGEQLPSVIRYGYGYLQGINDAALLLDNADTIEVNYWYADTFLPDDTIRQVSGDWYESGTQVIFSCGGDICQSVLQSAGQYDGYLIGVDVDQSALSKRIITSAMKGVRSAVILILDEYYANGCLWPENQTDNVMSCGITEKCIELPLTDDAWRFNDASIEDYNMLYSKIKKGELSVSDETGSPPKLEIAVQYANLP